MKKDGDAAMTQHASNVRRITLRRSAQLTDMEWCEASCPPSSSESADGDAKISEEIKTCLNYCMNMLRRSPFRLLLFHLAAQRRLCSEKVWNSVIPDSSSANGDTYLEYGVHTKKFCDDMVHQGGTEYTDEGFCTGVCASSIKDEEDNLRIVKIRRDCEERCLSYMNRRERLCDSQFWEERVGYFKTTSHFNTCNAPDSFDYVSFLSARKDQEHVEFKTNQRHMDELPCQNSDDNDETFCTKACGEKVGAVCTKTCLDVMYEIEESRVDMFRLLQDCRTSSSCVLEIKSDVYKCDLEVNFGLAASNLKDVSVEESKGENTVLTRQTSSNVDSQGREMFLTLRKCRSRKKPTSYDLYVAMDPALREYLPTSMSSLSNAEAETASTTPSSTSWTSPALLRDGDVVVPHDRIKYYVSMPGGKVFLILLLDGNGDECETNVHPDVGDFATILHCDLADKDRPQFAMFHEGKVKSLTGTVTELVKRISPGQPTTKWWFHERMSPLRIDRRKYLVETQLSKGGGKLILALVGSFHELWFRGDREGVSHPLLPVMRRWTRGSTLYNEDDDVITKDAEGTSLSLRVPENMASLGFPKLIDILRMCTEEHDCRAVLKAKQSRRSCLVRIPTSLGMETDTCLFRLVKCTGAPRRYCPWGGTLIVELFKSEIVREFPPNGVCVPRGAVSYDFTGRTGFRITMQVPGEPIFRSGCPAPLSIEVIGEAINTLHPGIHLPSPPPTRLRAVTPPPTTSSASTVEDIPTEGQSITFDVSQILRASSIFERTTTLRKRRDWICAGNRGRSDPQCRALIPVQRKFEIDETVGLRAIASHATGPPGQDEGSSTRHEELNRAIEDVDFDVCVSRGLANADILRRKLRLKAISGVIGALFVIGTTPFVGPALEPFMVLLGVVVKIGIRFYVGGTYAMKSCIVEVASIFPALQEELVGEKEDWSYEASAEIARCMDTKNKLVRMVKSVAGTKKRAGRLAGTAVAGGATYATSLLSNAILVMSETIAGVIEFAAVTWEFTVDNVKYTIPIVGAVLALLEVVAGFYQSETLYRWAKMETMLGCSGSFASTDVVVNMFEEFTRFRGFISKNMDSATSLLRTAREDIEELERGGLSASTASPSEAEDPHIINVVKELFAEVMRAQEELRENFAQWSAKMNVESKT